jgi:hypothetical protein
MTVLDQTFLQSVLPTILGVDKKYVIPRQGNWSNAQDILGPPGKPNTWCAFALEDEHPVDLPFYVVDSTPACWTVQHNIARLALQFVGPKGKALASSVGHWLHRSDVLAAFAQVDGNVLGDFSISTVDFAQDGGNWVKAYTARIRVLYASEIETGQTRTGPGTDMAVLDFGGGLS